MLFAETRLYSKGAAMARSGYKSIMVDLLAIDHRNIDYRHNGSIVGSIVRRVIVKRCDRLIHILAPHRET
jgi:hypothetical protein